MDFLIDGQISSFCSSLAISNSNFAGYTGSKNLGQTRQKFQFIKLAGINVSLLTQNSKSESSESVNFIEKLDL